MLIIPWSLMNRSPACWRANGRAATGSRLLRQFGNEDLVATLGKSPSQPRCQSLGSAHLNHSGHLEWDQAVVKHTHFIHVYRRACCLRDLHELDYEVMAVMAR